MFTIGQRVVCISGKKSACGVKLQEFDTYVIKDIWRCKCHSVVDVGLRISTDDICFKCNTVLSTDGTWWLYSKRFVPLQEWENSDLDIERIIEEIREPVV